jgi:hypothetical protein
MSRRAKMTVTEAIRFMEAEVTNSRYEDDTHHKLWLVAFTLWEEVKRLENEVDGLWDDIEDLRDGR